MNSFFSEGLLPCLAFSSKQFSRMVFDCTVVTFPHSSLIVMPFWLHLPVLLSRSLRYSSPLFYTPQFHIWALVLGHSFTAIHICLCKQCLGSWPFAWSVLQSKPISVWSYSALMHLPQRTRVFDSCSISLKTLRITLRQSPGSYNCSLVHILHCLQCVRALPPNLFGQFSLRYTCIKSLSRSGPHPQSYIPINGICSEWKAVF